VIPFDPPDLPEAAIRVAALYVPITVVAALAIHRRPDRRRVAGALLATVWNVAFLLVVNIVAVRQGWWTFSSDGPDVSGVPVDMWLGWALLWGAVPVLAIAGRHGSKVVAAAVPLGLVVADLALMPAAEPVVRLTSTWLIGEAVAVATCLVPGLLLGRWTAEDRRLPERAALQVGAFTATTFFVVPAMVFAAAGQDDGWSTLLDHARWQILAAALLASPVAAMALQAVAEFVAHGGTPVPLDPPKRLVTSGPYAYVANPMQLAGVVLFLGWGVLLGSPLLVGSATAVAAFCVGLAGWSEDRELDERFGDNWHHYRRSVRLWLPRWRPAGAEPAVVHVAERCDPCAEIGRFLRGRTTAGLEVRPAELCPVPLGRVTYERGDRRDSGIAAIARSLEHANLAWAAASWIARLPGVAQLLQLISDAVIGTPGATTAEPAPGR
jgi:protein-S-isoprenylcysteine O-methyltransferase Ste14